MPVRKKTRGDTLPVTFRQFTEKFPEIAAAHEAIARAVDRLGPLDRKTCELIKLGMSIGAGGGGAPQSHTRRARREGASIEEIEQAILLTMNTCGFPRTVAAWQWARQALTRR